MMQGVREVTLAPCLIAQPTIKAETKLQRGRNSCKPAVKHVDPLLRYKSTYLHCAQFFPSFF